MVGIQVLMVFVICAGVAELLAWLPTVLGPRRLSPVKLETSECDEVRVALPEGRFASKFSTTAIFFIIFDIELMFVFPWTAVYRNFEPRVFGFPELLVFLGIVMLGLLYVWRKGGLEWD